MLTNSYTRATKYFFPLLFSIISISSVFSPTEVEAAKNYYFSSSIGDDTRTPIQAQNKTTPWKTINKLNSFFISMLPGDSILLKSGDIFYGSLIISKSGSTASPIAIGSYGPGEKPIISGFQTVTQWINEGSGIYSKAITVESTPNLVTIHGVVTPKGRYPNTDVLTYESFSGTTSITDNQLINSPNWTGAEVVIRPNPYNWVRHTISNHTNSVITYSGSTAELHKGYGYFIQNDLKTLDLLGEWVYISGKLYMFFGANIPTSYNVKVSTLDYGIKSTSRSYVSISGLSVEGFNKTNILINGTSVGVYIKSCTSNYSGELGISTSGSTGINIESCIINNSLATGYYHTGSNARILNNTITNSGIWYGMSKSVGAGHGIEIVSGDNITIQYNHIDSTGKHGIFMRGNNTLVKNNYIEYAALLHDDVGGIYVSGSTYTGRQIIGNIVLHTKGNLEGMLSTSGNTSEGIYLDSGSNGAGGVYVEGNTVAYSGRGGLRFHNGHGITARHNTLYDNPVNILIVKSYTGTAYSNNQTINNNISVCKTDLQLAFFINHYFDGEPLTFGTSDSNYFCRPTLDTKTIRTNKPALNAYYTLDQFKTASGNDIHSNKSPLTLTNANDIIFHYNATQSIKIIPLNGTYLGVDSAIYSESITLLPFTSKVLIKSPTNINNIQPAIQNQSFQLNENRPIGTVVGIVVATDPDAGQTKTFSIISGNTNSAFAINASTGVLTVASLAALNYEVTPAFALVIKVQDNGTGNLSSQATITVSLTNVNEIPVIANQSFSVAENSVNGKTIGTVLATDPDAGQTKTFSIISGNTNSAFAINSSTGVITVASLAALNYEVTPAFELVIKVQDNGTGNLSSQATITVSLTNVNEIPVIANQSFSVAENSVNGKTIGTVVAIDPDAGQTKTFSVVSGNTNGAFAINTATGVLTVASASALNFEATPTFALVIKVQDNGTGNLSSQATITVSLTNINEIPVIANQSFSVNENSVNGTIVGTIVATDSDAGQTISFSIVSGNNSEAFSLNAVSGVLTIINSAALKYSINPIFSLGVKVSDNGTGNLFNNSVITVSVMPGPNQPPVITDQTFTVSQNSPTGTLVGIVEAADPDAEQSLAYSIVSGNATGAFGINSSTGEISVANPSALVFKSASSIELIVKVQDNSSVSLSSQALVTVLILPANAPPIILNQTKSTLEHQPSGTVVGIIQASDPNSAEPLQYSITSGNIDSGFALDASSGLLTINNPTVVCFEGNPLFNLSVKVQNIEGLSSEALITVNIADINETPVCKDQIFSIAENALIQTVVGTVVAKDYDFNQTLTYSILSGNSDNAFTIDPNNGSIIVNNPAAINFEAKENYSLVISVQDNGQGNLVAFSTIKIDLIDVNESPVMENQALNVMENSAPGTRIGYLLAKDPDKGQKLTYKIASGNEGLAFDLDYSSGLITVADPSKIYYGRNPLFILTVIAQDDGIESLSTLSVITINILRDSTEIIQTEKEEITVEDAFSERDISVYPNPTVDIVNIDLEKAIDQPVDIRIFSMTGVEIYSSTTKGEKNVVVNMADEKPGTYVAVITIEGHRYSRNIVVQNRN